LSQINLVHKDLTDELIFAVYERISS
jgi:hypothetical protein